MVNIFSICREHSVLCVIPIHGIVLSVTSLILRVGSLSVLSSTQQYLVTF